MLTTVGSNTTAINVTTESIVIAAEIIIVLICIDQCRLFVILHRIFFFSVLLKNQVVLERRFDLHIPMKVFHLLIDITNKVNCLLNCKSAEIKSCSKEREKLFSVFD